MVKKNNSKYIWVGVAIILVLVLVWNFGSNSKDEVTCNSPYIKVGDSCCLDQNGNDICDSDEVENFEDENGFDFWVYADMDGTGHYGQNHLEEETLTIYKSFNQKFISGPLEEGYGGLFLHVFTEELNGESSCNIKEYYNGKINSETNKNLDSYVSGYLGTFILLSYEKDIKPQKVKYSIICERISDHESLTKDYTINLNYIEEFYTP